MHATRLALEAGVDVFCEKPLATSAVDAQSLARLAAEQARVLMVGFTADSPRYTKRGVRPSPKAVPPSVSPRRTGPGPSIAPRSKTRSTWSTSSAGIAGGEPIDVSAHAAGDDPWQEDGVSALIRFDNGHTGALMAARNAGAWSEKLDAYGDGVTANITAPDRISVSRPNGTTVREMSPEAFGWATATQTFGFAGAVHHFLDPRPRPS